MPASLPYNQISRLAGRMHVAMGPVVATHLTRARERGVVALLVMRMGVADWAQAGRIAPPAVRTRFGSINALSRSLDRPFETVRRHVHGLAKAGVVTVGREGIAPSDDPAVAARIAGFYVAAHDLLLDFMQALADRGLLPPARAGEGPTTEAILNAALDIALLPFERMRAPMDDWTTLTLWSGIASANVGHVIHDPVLDARYAVDYVDDAERRPVPLADLARATQVPYATAWRHVAELERRGLVERRGGGWVVAARHYHDPAVHGGMQSSAHYHLRRLGELAAQGLDPARATERALGAGVPARF